MPMDPNELFPEIPNLYEFPSVHLDMIFDEHRVMAYQRAISKTVRQGDVVVDVGTGTGLLAFLCLKSGAERVHAIDRSPIIACARELAEANGLQDRIQFHNYDSRKMQIGEPADLIISELIGHIAFEEGMVETLFDARRRFLKANGSMIPRSVHLFAAPVVEREAYATCIDGWKPAYGIDYSVMRRRALATTYITNIRETDLVARHSPIFSVDFSDLATPDLQTERRFQIYRMGRVNGLAFWFDAMLSDDVWLSSGPWAKTHWNQCFAPIPEPIPCEVGDVVHASVSMRLRSRREDSFTFAVEMYKEG